MGLVFTVKGLKGDRANRSIYRFYRDDGRDNGHYNLGFRVLRGFVALGFEGVWGFGLFLGVLGVGGLRASTGSLWSRGWM